MDTKDTTVAYPMDAEELKYWARRGPKTAAFLLVIPGCVLMGAGVGLLYGHLAADTLIGLGGGLLVWGMIVALVN